MHIIVTAWIYVVAMMAIVEALSNQGTLLGALFTFLGFGVLPVALMLYLFRGRRRKDPGLPPSSAD